MARVEVRQLRYRGESAKAGRVEFAVADALAARHPGRVEVIHRTGARGLGRSYIEGIRVALARRVVHGGGERLVAACAQVRGDHPQDRGLVVNHQDPVTHTVSIGSSRDDAVPWPVFLTASLRAAAGP